MLKIRQLHHVSLNVTDLQAAKDFYGGVLGLTELDRPDFPFPGAWYAIGPDGQQLHLIVHQGETLRKGGLNTRDGHLAIRVESFEDTVRWLEKCGVPFQARFETTAGFPQIYVMDPDHNIVEINTEPSK